jgi:hypothetical protein
MDSYLKMIKHMADLYRQYEDQMINAPSDAADFAEFVEALDEQRFHQMMAGVPALFGAATDPLFAYNFRLKDLKRLTESDTRWDEILAATGAMPLAMDLTDPDQERKAFETADKLLELYPSKRELEQIDSRIVIEQRRHPVILHLGLKLAMSKTSLRSITTPVFTSFIVAMFNEHNRIRTHLEHPAGEDFLRRKVLQLEWLFDGEIDQKWELVFVDDGCPKNSGKIAEEIIKKERYQNAKVLFLADGISEDAVVTKGLSSTDDSQKGGAIQYGMWSAIQRHHDTDRHLIFFTDSDLSTNIAQAGLLLCQLEDHHRMCAIGTRYSAGGIYCTPAGATGVTDHDRLMLVFRHFIRTKLLPQIGTTIDTQCGFKAFKAEVLKKVLGRMTDKRFSFDMELLLLTALQNESGDNIVGEAPIVWIESNEESNFYSDHLEENG